MTDLTATPCSCPQAGYCQQFRRNMPEPLWRICRGETEKLSPEQCESYRQLWSRQAAGITSPKPRKAKCSPPSGYRGPGSVLKDYFAWFGLHEKKGCGCKNKARKMDCRGPEWCQDNFDLVIGWLRDSAQKQDLIFLEIPARIVLQWAINQSKYERSLVEEGA